VTRSGTPIRGAEMEARGRAACGSTE
jgi:hypothetical protein